MPHSIFFVLLIELALILVTVFLLIQPKRFFKSESKRIRTIANWSGMIFLCITFCWSVVVGIILSTHGLVIRL